MISVINSYNEFYSKTVIEEILQDKKNVSVFEINKVKKMLDEFNLLYDLVGWGSYDKNISKKDIS